MRILLVLLLVAVSCTGNRLNVHKLIDILREQNVVEAKRHGIPPEAKRHGIPPEGKRMETTQQSTTTDETTYFTTDVPSTTYFPDSRESLDYEEAFLFPGSHYLVHMIREHCESGMGFRMSVDDIVEEVEIPECVLKEIGHVFSLLGRVSDTDGVAILATRMIIKPMFMSRLNCPASVLEMALTRLLLAKKQHFIADDDESLYRFLKEMAPMVDPALAEFADDIALRGALEVHELLFRETLDFLWKFNLKDVAYGSHSIYSVLQNHFQQVVTGMDISDPDSVHLRMQVGSVLSGIQCPLACQIVQSHTEEIQRFKDVFAMIETEHICLKVIEFLINYISSAMPQHQPSFENNSALENVCQGIKLVIEESVEQYTKYESFLTTRVISDFKMMAENVLPAEEMTVLEEAIIKLGLMDESRPSCD